MLFSTATVAVVIPVVERKEFVGIVAAACVFKTFPTVVAIVAVIVAITVGAGIGITAVAVIMAILLRQRQATEMAALLVPVTERVRLRRLR